MATLEIELKNLLTADQFRQIKQQFEFARAFTQTNYYFDTPDQQLYQQHCGLRIRIFNDYAEQTLKVPTAQATANQHELLEITDRLPQELATKQQLLKTGEVTAALAQRQISLAQLKVFAAATTTRQIATLNVGKLTLDQTNYPNGHQDYELELETTTPREAQEFFVELLQQHQISRAPVINKVARAVQNQL